MVLQLMIHAKTTSTILLFFAILIVCICLFVYEAVIVQTTVLMRNLSIRDQALKSGYSEITFYQTSQDLSKTVAIGCAITGASLQNVTEQSIPYAFQFFSALLPSFCKTISRGFQYHFYLAYDHDDTIFNTPDLMKAFQNHFVHRKTQLCPRWKDTGVDLHMVKCNHSKKPAWAQNDAMMEAYLDGIEYFYRINDDTILETSDWATIFIQTLKSFHPPNVGVVGPKQGNASILTYDFVHRTHIDIFGYYYPSYFTDWFADGWMTLVYRDSNNGSNFQQLEDTRVTHTMALGRRYTVNMEKLKGQCVQIRNSEQVLQRYTERKVNKNMSVSGWHVISMVLHSANDFKALLRTAQLAPIYLPDWVLRIYVDADLYKEQQSLQRMVNVLYRLGVQIALVNTSLIKLSSIHWSYLVADDKHVEAFIIRNAANHINSCEITAANKWPKTAHSFLCHCTNATNDLNLDNTWGALMKPLHYMLHKSMEEFLLSRDNGTNLDLNNGLQVCRNNTYCLKSIKCNLLDDEINSIDETKRTCKAMFKPKKVSFKLTRPTRLPKNLSHKTQTSVGHISTFKQSHV